jgi:uncharacterized protein YecE (DUF72 family)
VYSRAEKDVNFLEEYAQKYDSVEVDQWFWSLFPGSTPVLPRPGTAAEYAASVPATFRFTVKAPNSVTLSHYYKKKKEDDLVVNPHFLSVPLFVRFLKGIAPLHPLLGPVMLQFEYLNKMKMASQRQFLKSLDIFLSSLPGGFTLALEPRNPNYLNRAWFDFLCDHGVGHVFLQGYYMPPVTTVYERFRDSIRGTAVIRLHGTERDGMEKLTGDRWNRIVAPRDNELPAVADMVRDLLQRNVDVYLNVNNHYEGSAPLTIEKLIGLLVEKN